MPTLDGACDQYCISRLRYAQNCSAHRCRQLLRAKLRGARISVEGRRVDHYLPTGPLPKNYAELVVDRGDEPRTRLAIKLEHEFEHVRVHTERGGDQRRQR